MLSTKKKLLEYISKYNELILYGLFGGLTTIINILTYYFLVHGVNIPFMISNAIAWIFAFIFAYYTNSKYVFNYKPFSEKDSIKRLVKFLNSRMFTGLLDMLLMWILVKKLIINDSASKVIVNIIVIVLNYVMSKYLIFKGEEL